MSKDKFADYLIAVAKEEKPLTVAGILANASGDGRSASFESYMQSRPDMSPALWRLVCGVSARVVDMLQPVVERHRE